MADSEAMLDLKVKTLLPATYEVRASAESTVGQLKEQLVSLSGVPVDRQRLIFRGSVLQDAQLLASQRIESGHTIHMVERPEGLPPPGSIPETQPLTEQRIDVGLIHINGATTIAATGGMTGVLQSLAGQIGNQHMQVITHPPIGNQQGAPQIVQMVSGNGGQRGPPAPHQLTAINSYLLHLETAARPTSFPPFSMVSRLGQIEADEASFLDTARAALNGVSLPPDLQDFVRNVRLRDFGVDGRGPSQQAVTAAQQPPDGGTHTSRQQRRDPRRNGIDGSQTRPRPIPIGSDMMRLSTLAVSQVARQAITYTQASALPAMAAAVNSLREHVEHNTANGASVLEQARDLSNTTYELGSLLLELSLATANLAQAANGNAGPLLCAQTGFLAPDGSHAHVTNRSPAVNPFMGLAGRMPVNPQNAQGRPAQGREQQRPGAAAVQSAASPAGTSSSAAAASSAPAAAPAPAPDMDTADPLAHAFFNAVTDDETRTRHMRLPVRLPDGTDIRLDLSSVINALEAFILSTPTDVLTGVLSAAMQGSEGARRGLRELMTMRQTDAQRRQIYLNLTQPILQTALDNIRSYFQQLYRIAPRQPGQEQSVIRPTRRAANRPVPSLTHPFASVPNPARDALSMSMEAPDALHAGVAGAPAGMAFGLPGGQVHLEMSLEGSLNIPAEVADMWHADLEEQNGQQQPPFDFRAALRGASEAENDIQQQLPASGNENTRAAPASPGRSDHMQGAQDDVQTDSNNLQQGSAQPFFRATAEGTPSPEPSQRWHLQPAADSTSTATPGFAASPAEAMSDPGAATSGNPVLDNHTEQPACRPPFQTNHKPQAGGSSELPASTHVGSSVDAPQKGKGLAGEKAQPAKGLGGGLPALPVRRRPVSAGVKAPTTAGKPMSSKRPAITGAASSSLTPPKHLEAGFGKAEHTGDASARKANDNAIIEEPGDMPEDLGHSTGHQQAAGNHVVDLPSLARASDSIPGPASGGLLSMMEQMLRSPSIQQMMQSPAVQQMLESPQLERITESPAFRQIADGMLGGVPPGLQSQPRALAPSNPSMSPGQGVAGLPNMNAMLQSSTPNAQQMMGSTDPAGRIQQQQQPQPPPPTASLSGSEDRILGEADGVLTIASSAQQGSRRSDFEFEELLGLPDEDAKRWEEIILLDKRAWSGADKEAMSLSAAYLKAMGAKSGQSSAPDVLD